jgi:hypothetical protein
MTANRLSLSSTILLLLAGCMPMAQYEDLSAEPAYRELIGQDLRSTSDLLVHGVTLDRNYAKRVDLCSVTPAPGFSGPEVVTCQSLPAGATFRIVGVRRCTNCHSLSTPVKLLVTSSSTTVCGSAPVEISEYLLNSSVTLVPLARGGAPNNSFKPTPLRGAA